MFDFMTKLLPVWQMLKLVANEISKQLGFLCVKYDMRYNAIADDLDFIVYHDDGTKTVHGYEDKSTIGGIIKLHVSPKMKPGEALHYVIIHWSADGTHKGCDVYYVDANGEKQQTNIDWFNL